MSNRNIDPSWLEKISSTDGFWQGLVQQLKLVWRLLFDRRVPIWVKVVPFISIAYLFIPADIVPDFFVGLGQLDDLAIIALGLKLFLELAPPDVINEHMNALISAKHEWTVIDSEAELVDDPDS
jgi:uncharacterized membrane protein YkvA (DUF1232 family)